MLRVVDAGCAAPRGPRGCVPPAAKGGGVVRQDDPGFTLVELMVAVSIIGILAILAIPAFRLATQRSANSAFINDLRLLADDAIGRYAITSRDYPPDEPPGVVPPEVAAYLPHRLDWSRPTPIDGMWDWDRAPSRAETLHGCYAGLSVVNPSRTSAQMQQIDAIVDDGNLSTGRFRARPNGYIYVIE
jgi:prepilin-type N-terminal cleavage/methylation domain-containing protein